MRVKSGEKCKNCGSLFAPYSKTDKFCKQECRHEYAESEKVNLKNRCGRIARIYEGKRARRSYNTLAGRNPEKHEAEARELERNSSLLREEIIDFNGHLLCQKCGKSGGTRFETHHIIRIGEKPHHEFLHDIRNLILLCSGCSEEMETYKYLRNDIVLERELHLLFGDDVLNK